MCFFLTIDFQTILKSFLHFKTYLRDPGVGLDPAVSLLTQLWESKQVYFQVISIDQVSFFLKESTPSLCPINPGGRAAPVLNLASKLDSQLGWTGTAWLLKESLHGWTKPKARRCAWCKEPAVRLWLGSIYYPGIRSCVRCSAKSWALAKLPGKFPSTHTWPYTDSKASWQLAGMGECGGREGLILTEPLLHASPGPSTW